MRNAWILAHLLLLSAQDMKEMQLSILWIMELGIVGLVRAVYMCGTVEWLPGIIFLSLGYVSGEKIGYGDGWLLLSLGMWMSLEELLYMLSLGLLSCAVFSIGSGRRELPLVPFLTAAWILGGFL